MTDQTTAHAPTSEAAPERRDDHSPFAAARTSALRSPVATLVLAAGLAASGAAAWWWSRQEAPPPAAAAPVASDHPTESPVMLTAEAAARIGVTYAAVERGPLATEVRAGGVVTYDETRVKTISPKVDGYVEELLVAFIGQPVEEGQPLLRLYSPMLVTAQDELLLARQLVSDVGATDADAARNASALLASARRRLKAWDVSDDEIAQVERGAEARRTITLRAPIRGVVVQKNVQAGQRIMAGDALYQVADLREVWLEGAVFEADLPAVRVGQAVVAEVAGVAGGARTGRIAFVSAAVAPDTRTATVRVALANGDSRLKPGMFATLRIRGAARANALSVPRSAVLVSGERTLVFVSGADGMLTPREVVLGAMTSDRVEVVSGLRAGETVVASATFLVDAESNLGSALGAMAGMPGMDHGAPPAGQAKPAAPPPDPMAGMPGMDHGPTRKKP